MNNTSIESALQAIEESRELLIDTVNIKLDALKQRILDRETTGDYAEPVRREARYPLSTVPAVFKGTKPTAIFFGSEKVPANTWRKVYTEILKRCACDQISYSALLHLRNRVSGRKRAVLSDSPSGMDVPIRLSDELFVEAYFDTEWLIRTLTQQILDAVHFDYSGISVSVMEKGGRVDEQ